MAIPSEIEQRLAVWDKSAIQYMVIGFGLLLLSILASLSVTAFADTLGSAAVRIFGFIAGVCTALLASFNPIDSGFKFRQAWRILDSAILRYKIAPTNNLLEKILEAVEQGEAIIGSISAPSQRISAATPPVAQKAARTSE